MYLDLKDQSSFPVGIQFFKQFRLPVILTLCPLCGEHCGVKDLTPSKMPTNLFNVWRRSSVHSNLKRFYSVVDQIYDGLPRKRDVDALVVFKRMERS